MSDDLVRAEVNAVRALKHGVASYSERIREVLANARREMGALDRNGQDAVAKRRSEANKREQELRLAEAALRQCQDNCGGLQRQVGEAVQRLAEAKQSLDRARKAAQLIADARSNLLNAMQNVEATVAEHSSVAAAALASLDAKLRELPKFGVGHALHNLAVAATVSTELADAIVNFAPTAGDALHAANINAPVGDASIAQMVEHRQGQESNYVIEQDFESRKRAASSEGQKTQS